MPPSATAELDLRVDRDSELAPSTQLAWKLRALLAAGRIAPGERLPSVRELAELAGVNVNTARAVYGRLEEEGLIASRHGLGTFAADRPASTEEINRIASEALFEARDAGLDPRQLAAAIYAAADLPEPAPSRISSTPLPDPTTESDQPGVRRDLRRQIARLEAELGAYAEHLPRRDDGVHPLLRPRGHVAGTEELERTRDRLSAQLAEVRSEEARRGKREREAREKRERLVAEPQQHKWQWVSNEDVGEPGCKTWHSRPRYGVIGMFMGWWRVKVSSGCPLAATA